MLVRVPPALSLLAASWLGACGPRDPIDTDLPTTGTPTWTTPTTTEPPFDDEGNIQLVIRRAGAADPAVQVLLAGVFADSMRDYRNLATCGLFGEGTYCTKVFPEVLDEAIDVDPWVDTIFGPLETTSVGNKFTLGPYQADKVDAGNLRVYQAVGLATLGPPVDGEMDLVLPGGDYDRYEALDVVPVPDPMIALQPDPDRAITLSTGVFPLRWVPGLVGQVYLTIETETVRKLFLLEDDGHHDLDVTALGLTDLEEVTLTLARWGHAFHDAAGNTLEIIVQDEQRYVGTFRDLTGRTELFGADSCPQAQYLPMLTSGEYFGRLTGHTNQLSPSGACASQGGGPEAIFRSQLNPGGEITVDYLIFGADASLYLMSDCGDMSTCLDGSNVNGNANAERVNWINDLGGPTDVFVVLDSKSGPVDDVFIADVDVIDLFPSPLVDACAQALYQAPLTAIPAGTDRYEGDITNFHNYVDPAGGCGPATLPMGIAAPGQEGMVKVELANGETVTATVEMPGADPVVYFLYNCANSASCPIGADANTTAFETAVYQNTSGFNEVIYLVVDSHGGSASFTLDLKVE